MGRIPSIKFPLRHLKSTFSGTEAQTKVAAGAVSTHKSSTSDVPAAPPGLSVGGKASLQPKRTPVSDKEIEAVMLGGCT